MVTNILLGVVIVLLLVLIYLIGTKRASDSKRLEAVLSKAWLNLGIDKKVGRLELYAQDIRDD